MIFFNKESIPKKKIFFWEVRLGWGAGDGGARVSEFLLLRIHIYLLFLGGEGEGRGRGRGGG